MDLFPSEPDSVSAEMPLAARMRPRTLEEFVGQRHLLGEGKILRRAIEADRLRSVVLYGPPGCGKSALGALIASLTQAHVERVNAVAAGVDDLRRALEAARFRRTNQGRRTILFIDEIHRFNRAQQDVLMPEVEEGTVTLIGATTHNPFFSLVSPLLSRSLVAEFKPLSSEDLTTLLTRALSDPERGLGSQRLRVDEEAIRFLAEISDGDARRALNGLELAAMTTPPEEGGTIRITRRAAEESVQKKAVVYDQKGDAHYDTISAYIKSMRGSDPDAALYWLAKMLYAGEDPRFIARRLVICSAEDVGNADPQALVVATAAQQAVEFIGLPECRIPLAQATVYVACAPKSNAAYLGIEAAMKDVESGRTLEVPSHLKDAHYPGAQRLGHGKGYKYAHSYPGHHVEQDYLPGGNLARLLEKRRYYRPTDQGFEQELKLRLSRWRTAGLAAWLLLAGLGCPAAAAPPEEEKPRPIVEDAVAQARRQTGVWHVLSAGALRRYPGLEPLADRIPVLLLDDPTQTEAALRLAERVPLSVVHYYGTEEEMAGVKPVLFNLIGLEEQQLALHPLKEGPAAQFLQSLFQVLAAGSDPPRLDWTELASALEAAVPPSRPATGPVAGGEASATAPAGPESFDTAAHPELVEGERQAQDRLVEEPGFEMDTESEAAVSARLLAELEEKNRQILYLTAEVQKLKQHLEEFRRNYAQRTAELDELRLGRGPSPRPANPKGSKGLDKELGN